MVKVPAQTKSLGDFIAAQRQAAGVSLRQLAEATGVSNPYLSQIERGLRKPSADVLQQLAKALRVSAESLYIHAGILDPDDHEALDVPKAVLADPSINERQKQSLLEIYAAFVDQNRASAPDHLSNPTSDEGSTHASSSSKSRPGTRTRAATAHTKEE